MWFAESGVAEFGDPESRNYGVAEFGTAELRSCVIGINCGRRIPGTVLSLLFVVELRC